MNKYRITLSLALAMALGLPFTSAIAGNHTVYDNEVASSTDLTSGDISDQQLEAFLHAGQQVQQIRSNYAEMLREADADEREELRDAAVDDMTTAIQFLGLDVDTYRAIGYLYQNDDDVRRRLNAVAAGM